MSTARMIIRNFAQFQHDMKTCDEKRRKAAEAAVRIECFRLRGILQKDIRNSRAGGMKFHPLSVIARRLTTHKLRQARARKPLYKLASIVRYRVKDTFDKQKVFQVGFVDPGGRGRLSKSWVRIAFVQQEGVTVPLDEKKRRQILRRGFELMRSRDYESARFFMLRKTTRSVTIPQRQIIEPFWFANVRKTTRNIEENFRRKLAGEFI